MYNPGFTQPFRAAKERRARYPFLFEMGPVTLALVAILALALPSLLYVTKAGSVATSGYHIRRLEQQRDELRREREQLLLRAAELQNLGRIEQEARRLGMVPATAPEFVNGTAHPQPSPTAITRPQPSHAPWDAPLSAAWWQRYLPALRQQATRSDGVAAAGAGSADSAGERPVPAAAAAASPAAPPQSRPASAAPVAAAPQPTAAPTVANRAPTAPPPQSAATAAPGVSRPSPAAQAPAAGGAGQAAAPKPAATPR